ncbi:MAG TPA: deoxyribodipyrimidine photo-lyase [Bryobacteraceae bacterium]|nr:deoxyribodipyrimidine photo-lyase [Bryobacteraceae bacterium]
MYLSQRIQPLNDLPIRPSGRYVLYWTQMNRRADSNQALAHAASEANRLQLPLLVYEGLTCTYTEANDRMHTFVLEGVPEQQRRLAALGAGYCFYLRKRVSDDNRVLYRLAAEAALVVTDDYPTFIAARHNAKVPARIGVAFHAVDASCVIPMAHFTKQEWAAYTIRPKIHKVLREHLHPVPAITLAHRWQLPIPQWHTEVTPANIASLVAACEIDHSVKPSHTFTGGRLAAEKALHAFLTARLRRYAGEKNSPSNHVTSDLSPYLHFGQISALEVALAAEGYAEEHKLVAAEFLEELIVRRELAFNFTRFCPDYESLAALPDWVQLTMRKHANDHRDYLYTPEQFAHARTHDPLWNACQKEMLLRGKIHGYYRMYWGKKIMEWSPSLQQAQDTMIHIHDRYALDGRDPNTYTSILWCFGLHDRPWGERPVFGTIRYMGYDGMKRKTDVPSYIREIDHLERTGIDPFRTA